jgi:hypothetical protein
MTSSARRAPKCQLVIEHMSTHYMILTPRGNLITKQLVINAPLNLAGKVYKTHLIVLDGQGIGVILGISWMKDHKALLNTASRTMQLDSPDLGIVVLQLPSPSSTTPSLHHTTARSWKIFVLHVSFQMCFLRICLACHQIGMWSSPLNYNQVWYLSQDGHTR